MERRYLLRNGRTLWLEWNEAVGEAIDDGFTWMVRTDITSYFDNIEHRLLFADLDGLNADPTVITALRECLASGPPPRTGIPQGPDVCRLLGNLSLFAVDDVMTAGPWRYYRYLDDFKVLGSSRREVSKACANSSERVGDAG